MDRESNIVHERGPVYAYRTAQGFDIRCNAPWGGHSVTMGTKPLDTPIERVRQIVERFGAYPKETLRHCGF